MARVVVENGHQKDTCYHETGLCTQNKDSTLGTIDSTIGGPMGLPKEKEQSTL